jgi:hypothetical protein
MDPAGATGTPTPAAATALNAMSVPERELFARGYASEKADLIERNGPGGNLLDSAALESPAERQKLELALGPRRTAALDRGMLANRLYHAFDGATSAGEAGRNFVMGEISREDAARTLARMTPQDRESFARNFGEELARMVMDRRQDNLSVVKKAFIDSHRAREKINLALGPDRARELEAALRAETVADRVKGILGNSATERNRNLKNILMSGAHGGGAAGALVGLETLRETDYDPKSIIATALVWGALRHGAHHIDAKVARRIGEMLMSNDPTILQRGVKTVARSPQLFNALRKGTEAGTRVSAHDIGPSGVGAGAAALLEHIMSEDEPHGHHGDDQYNAAQPVQQ